MMKVQNVKSWTHKHVVLVASTGLRRADVDELPGEYMLQLYAATHTHTHTHTHTDTHA